MSLRDMYSFLCVSCIIVIQISSIIHFLSFKKCSPSMENVSLNLMSRTYKERERERGVKREVILIMLLKLRECRRAISFLQIFSPSHFIFLSLSLSLSLIISLSLFMFHRSFLNFLIRVSLIFLLPLKLSVSLHHQQQKLRRVE